MPTLLKAVKWPVLALLLFLSINVSAQIPVRPSGLPSPKAPASYYEVGTMRADSFGVQFVPRLGDYQPIAGLNGLRFHGDTMYIWNIGSVSWIPVTTGGITATPTWQEGLDAPNGSLLTHDNTVDGAGYGFTFDNFSSIDLRTINGASGGRIGIGDPVIPVILSASRSTGGGHNSLILLNTDSIEIFNKDSIYTLYSPFNSSTFGKRYFLTQDQNYHLQRIDSAGMSSLLAGDYLQVVNGKLAGGNTGSNTANPSIRIPGDQVFQVEKRLNLVDQTTSDGLVLGKLQLNTIANSRANGVDYAPGVESNEILKLVGTTDTTYLTTGSKGSMFSILNFSRAGTNTENVYLYHRGTNVLAGNVSRVGQTDGDTLGTAKTWNIFGTYPNYFALQNIPNKGTDSTHYFYDADITKQGSSIFHENKAVIYHGRDLTARYPAYDSLFFMEQEGRGMIVKMNSNTIITPNVPAGTAVNNVGLDANGKWVTTSAAATGFFTPTIATMQALTVSYTSVIVQDTTRGGLFNLVNSVTMVADNFLRFAATGIGANYFWVRSVTNNQYFVGWADVYTASTVRGQYNALQSVFVNTPNHAVIYGDPTRMITVDSSVYVRHGATVRDIWIKAQINPLVIAAQLQHIFRTQSDSVYFYNMIADGSSGSVVDDALRFDAFHFADCNDVGIYYSRIFNVRKNGTEFQRVTNGRAIGNNYDSCYRDAVSLVTTRSCWVENNFVTHSLSGGGGEISDGSIGTKWLNNTVKYCVYAWDLDAHSGTDVNSDNLVQGILSDSNQNFLKHGSFTSTQKNLTIRDCIIKHGLDNTNGDINLGGNIDGLLIDNVTIDSAGYTTAPAITIAKTNNLTVSNIHFKGAFTGRLGDFKTAFSGSFSTGLILQNWDCNDINMSTANINITNTNNVLVTGMKIIGNASNSGDILSIQQSSDVKVVSNTFTTTSANAIKYTPTSTQSGFVALNNTTTGTSGVLLSGNFFTTYEVSNSGTFNKTAGIGSNYFGVGGLGAAATGDSVVTTVGNIMGIVARTALLANQGTTTTVLHGNASGNPTFGNVVNADIQSSTIANSRLATMATLTFKANVTGGTANPTDATVAQVNTALGTVSSTGNLSPLFTASIVSNALTFALSNAAANTVYGNNTNGSAAPGYQTSINVSSGITSGTALTAPHHAGSGSAPGISAGAALGTGAAVSISGTDAAMQVVLTGGVGASTGGALATVTFATAYASAPKAIIIQAADANGTLTFNNGIYIDKAQITTGGFVIQTAAFAATSTIVYSYYIQVIQ